MRSRFKFLSVALMVAALLVSLSSCQKDPDTEKTKGNITLYVDSLEALPEGDMLRVNYDITERQDGVELVAECKDEWISSIEVRYSLIDITVECNRSGAERSATIELNYGGARESLTITQKPWFEPLALTIDKVEATAVTISVAALDESTTWIGQVVSKEWFDSYSEEDIFYEDLNYYRLMASDAELSLEEYLSSILSHGSHSGIRMKGLDSESDYVVYIYGMNELGEKTTALYSKHFTTPAPYEGNDVTYEFDVVCERSVATISIEPSHEGVAYYNNITTREHFEQCGSDINALVEDVVATALDNYLYWDMTEAEFYENNTEYFATSYEMETLSATDYVVFAFKWDENLKPISEVSYKWFTSNEVKPSDNKLSMTISQVTQTTFYVETTTTNDDPYTIFAVPTASIKKLMADDEIFDYIIKEYGAPELAYNQCVGDVKGTFSGLEADTEYTVLLFGYEAGTRTTAMKREKIKTAAAGDVEACIYTVEVTDVADRTARVTITPSDYSVWYYWNVFEASTTEEEIKSYIEQTINGYYYGDYSEFSWEEITQGATSSYISQLRPSTDYKVVVVPMNPRMFEYTGSLRSVGEFRTQEAVIADIDITAKIEAYYDGDELIEVGGDDWNFSHYAGYAVAPISVNVDGQHSGFLFTIFDYVDGLDDPEKYDDNVLLDTLYEVGAYWTPAYFRCAWDTQLMIAAVAFDMQGNPSRVYRECVMLTRDGANDAQEFIDFYMGGTSAVALTSAAKKCQNADSVAVQRPVVEKCVSERAMRLNKR